MTKKEVAQTIVDICRNDASFCKDIEGGNADRFLSEISEEMDEKTFLFSVDSYLASFGVRGHLYFYKKSNVPYSIGFRVRQYQDSLFVTSSEEELPIFNGDEIIAINGTPIAQVAEDFHVFFHEGSARCGDIWGKIISYSDTVTVKRMDKIFEYIVRTDVKRTERPSFECKKLADDCLYMRFGNFFDETEMQHFLADYKGEIETSQYLIIDVRENLGGSDTVFLPLLKYCLRENDNLCGKPIFTSAEEILFTERNVENRIKLYKSYFERAESEEVRRYFEKRIEEQINNKGKGFVQMEADSFLFAVSGSLLPEKIIVLTDYDCASSGESFVEIVSKLDKVTVIGRPTMGICDYSNLAYFDFGEYVLHYPTSRSMAIDEGRGTRGHGLLPDIFIHWSPKHIHEDIDITIALNLLRTK